MTHLISAPKAPAIPQQPIPPALTSEAAQQAAQELAATQAMARGRQSTILTSGLGDSTIAGQKKALLGS